MSSGDGGAGEIAQSMSVEVDEGGPVGDGGRSKPNKPPSAGIDSMVAKMEDDPGTQPLATVDEEGGEGEEDGLCSGRTLWTRVWQGTAGASIVVNIAAMAVEQSAIAVIAGVIAILIAPVVIAKQFQLQNTDSMRQVQNALRKDVNRLHNENKKLAAENTLLEGEVQKLREQELRLEKITRDQNSNVNSLVALVKENRTIIDEMRAAVKSQALQTLVESIIESDTDGSGKFSDREMKLLEMRLKNMRGVKVNHSRLVDTMSHSTRDLNGILKMVQNMDQVPEEDRIFVVDANMTPAEPAAE